MKRKKGIRRGNEPIPALWAWMNKHRRPVAGIFGVGRDFPITTKELATMKTRQTRLFERWDGV